MSGLAEFLLARIAEDEAAAHVEAALRNDDPYWTSGEASDWERRQTPARVLAECEAKRGIIETEALRLFGPPSDYVSEEVYNRLRERATSEVLCRLALPYADHPDYREEWRP